MILERHILNLKYRKTFILKTAEMVFLTFFGQVWVSSNKENCQKLNISFFETTFFFFF